MAGRAVTAYRRGSPPVCGRRNCRDCGRWRHLADFGRPGRTGASLCLVCRRARKRALYERERADPERLALRREYFRIYAYDVRRARGVPVRGPQRLWTGPGYADSAAPYGRSGAIDPGPLAAHVDAWVRAYDVSHLEGAWHQSNGGRKALAELAGVPERRIWGVLHGRRVHRVTADRLAAAIGLPLATIYGGEI